MQSLAQDVWEKWSPRDYLNYYYSGPELDEDEVELLKYCGSLLKKKARRYAMSLEVGCGPTLSHSVPLVPFVDEIHCSDYLEGNLAEIRKWLDREPDAFRWDVFFEKALEYEGIPADPAAIAKRQQELRAKLTTTLHVDLARELPLGQPTEYPLVTSFFCADSITDSKEQWRQFMNNLFTLVAPGGLLIVAALRKASHYEIQRKAANSPRQQFPSANVDENDLLEALQHGGFNPTTIDLQVVRFLGDCYKEREPGFEGVVLASAEKLTT
jgi:nicotinamide N-methyltransferase